MKDSKPTKPAGCALQTFGALPLLGGVLLITTGGAPIVGSMLAVFGLLLIYAGGKAVR